MIQLSERAQAMPASPIRKLVPYAEAAKRLGRHVYHLNIGQPDIATPPSALNAIHAYQPSVIEYSHSAGNESYRQKLAAYYTANGIPVQPEHILVTTGGSEALLFAFFTCLNAGDEVLSPEPFYANYNSFARMANVHMVPVPSTIESGFALPSIQEFEKRMTPRTKGILLCNPNNPTGYVYSEEELKALAHLVSRYNLVLFSDEVYREFCYDGLVPVSALTLNEIREQVVMIDSVSKRYSMCGVRVGAMVTHNRTVLNAALKFAQARLSPPSLGQAAAEAAIDTPSAYFEQVRNEYVLRRNLLVKRLNEMPGVLCPTPKGAFYAIARLPIDNSDAFCRWLLEDFSFDNQTVMLAPATGFYASPGGGTNEVRIGYVLNTSDLAAAMDCLEAALKQYPGRTNA